MHRIQRLRSLALRRAACGCAVAMLLAAACVPTAPPPKRTFTVGVVNLAPVLNPVLDGFKAGMQDLGYTEGDNITYIYAGPVGSIDKLKPEAQRLADAHVDLILALSTPATLATQQVISGTQMPVVFVPLTDPVGAGVVQSLGRPGGNLTGVTFGVQEARRLEWLVKLAPQAKRIYVPYNPDDPSPVIALKTVTEAAAKLGVTLEPRTARDDVEITAAVHDIPGDVDAIFLLPDSLIVSRAADFIQAALNAQLPLCSTTDKEVEAGALVAFGFKFFESGKQAARLADLILKGAKPADLPVETAEFFLSINLKTAQSIGLNIPDEYLRQADAVFR